MPKLNARQAKSVAKAEGGSFEPLEPGVYHVRLRDCAAKEGAKGIYWAWEFDVVEPGAHGRLWTNTSLSEKAEFKVNEAFAAFGVETNTDTDELVGRVCRAQVNITTIQQGNRKGENTNSVVKLLPADDGFEVPDDDGEKLDY
jgi:hypothetical protein